LAIGYSHTTWNGIWGARQRDVDWEQGARPIVYQSQSRTALDMGVSERQIQKVEKALFEAGAITWNDSGNHKRYGQRHPKSGRLIYAYGVELTPLAALASELEKKLQEKVLRDAAWMETKRQISWYRSQILAILREGHEKREHCKDWLAFQKRYNSISIQIRTSIDLSALRDLWNRHKSLYSELRSILDAETSENSEPILEASIAKETRKGSSKGEQKFVHFKSTTQEPFNKLNTGSPAGNCFQVSVVEPSQAKQIPDTGVQHVKIGVAVNAASQRFRDHLPTTDPQWRDIIEAAAKIRVELDISQQSWGDACQMLGRNGAALCVLVADQGSLRIENRVRQPAACFRGMLNKARDGELALYKSVFGLVRHW